MGKRLVILLVSSPASSRFSLALSIAESAAETGAEVNVFLMGESAYGILLERVQKLPEKGVKVTACRHNAEQKGVKKEYFGNVVSGSQYDLSYLVRDADVVLKF